MQKSRSNRRLGPFVAGKLCFGQEEMLAVVRQQQAALADEEDAIAPCGHLAVGYEARL